jgi:hypothetical protein
MRPARRNAVEAVPRDIPSPSLVTVVGDIPAVMSTTTGLAAVAPTAPALPPDDPTVWYHGEHVYSADMTGRDPVVVTDEEHDVLTAFARKQIAMTRADIEKSANVTNAPRIMKQLAKRYHGRFAAAVRRPGVKGKGGYFVRVRPLAQPGGD